MQTFLPYSNFSKSAKCLDNKRLGKQRVECLQILKALNNIYYGWQNHPAVKMWRGYDNALVLYGLSICKEWKKRGFKDTCYDKIYSFYVYSNYLRNRKLNINPPFIGRRDFHRSHKSKLLSKNPNHYSQFNWKVPNNLEYVWPNNMKKLSPKKLKKMLKVKHLIIGSKKY
jgi:hypothetical protein